MHTYAMAIQWVVGIHTLLTQQVTYISAAIQWVVGIPAAKTQFKGKN
jgi:hypothetical protein